MNAIKLLGAAAVLSLTIYLYMKWLYGYWRRRGLNYLEPKLFFGNAKEWITKKVSFADHFRQIYRELKAKNLRHGGFYIFFTPVYMPLDLELIKCILQKDFNHFVNHGMYVNEEVDPLTGHLFNLENEKWRNLRVKLTPTFTSGKMKMMFQTLVDCSFGLGDVLNDYAIIQDPVDIKDVLARFTTDVIGSCAFGLDCNSLKDPNSEFRKYGKKIFEPNLVDKMKRIAIPLLPRHILIKMRFKQTDEEIEDFFMNMIKDTVRYREEHNVYRKDFMHLLLQLKNRGEVADDEYIHKADEQKSALTINELAAQCFVFFLAGFETSATTMTFALYELAANQDIQQKLREEITSVLNRHDGKITYEAIMEMTYLDKVVSETLRKHPPIGGVPRVCNKTYAVPNSNIVLTPGTRVHIPIIGIQHDPEYYPNPEVFDPERFSEENKAKRPGFTFLPFGEGPRICIGLRFGLMQTKVGLASIISKYRLTLNKKTRMPLKYGTVSFILSAKGGIWLDVTKLE